ncbi:MAG: helix-turn-helix transcriptional regulator [Fibrobacter sp.]|nr:helix-turn-helix transcriptional regulator [Fibrobacter sp.]
MPTRSLFCRSRRGKKSCAIRARREKGITQKQLEALSGVKQPVIARMESGESDPRIGTVMKALAAIGMTLKVTPIQ